MTLTKQHYGSTGQRETKKEYRAERAREIDERKTRDKKDRRNNRDKR